MLGKKTSQNYDLPTYQHMPELPLPLDPQELWDRGHLKRGEGGLQVSSTERPLLPRVGSSTHTRTLMACLEGVVW